MEFGARLRMYREQAGMSQNALARASGLNPASINRLESGERSPSNRATVEQIADALGLSPNARDDLLTAAGHLPEVYSRVPPSDPTLQTVAAMLGDETLSGAGKEKLRAVIRALGTGLQSSDSPYEALLRVVADEALPAEERSAFVTVASLLTSRLSPSDPALQALLGTLADDSIPAEDRDELRRIVASIARRWSGGSR